MNGTHVNIDTSDNLDETTISQMVSLCAQMKCRSYSPYSRFPVGASLLCQDGTVFTGCNVENNSFELIICAEKTAIVKAVSEGHRKFKAIFISSNLEEFIVPCGACRQFLTEFGTEWDVYMTRANGTYVRMSVGELLPESCLPTKEMSRKRANSCVTGFPPEKTCVTGKPSNSNLSSTNTVVGNVYRQPSIILEN